MNFAIFIFKINSAVSIDRARDQWIHLETHPDAACMTRPETCGAAGGAISLWVNVIDCPQTAGIVTSIDDPDQSGFRIWCRHKEEIAEIG